MSEARMLRVRFMTVAAWWWPHVFAGACARNEPASTVAITVDSTRGYPVVTSSGDAAVVPSSLGYTAPRLRSGPSAFARPRRSLRPFTFTMDPRDRATRFPSYDQRSPTRIFAARTGRRVSRSLRIPTVPSSLPFQHLTARSWSRAQINTGSRSSPSRGTQAV